MIAADKAKLFAKKKSFLKKQVLSVIIRFFVKSSLRRKLHLLRGQMVFNK